MNDLSAVNAALNEGRTDEARELLREFLKTPDAETFFAASRVAVTDQQKRDFLQKAIELDPFHTQAHKALEAIAKPVSPSVFPPLPTASAPSMPPPPVATRAPRRIPRAGFAVLGVVVVLGVIGGGLFVASNNGTRNSIIPAAFVAATPTRRPGAQTSVTQTRLAQIARSTNIAAAATTAARNGPALTSTASAQITLGQNFLRYYFEKSYRQAGNLACRSISNAVNAGSYNNMARAFDQLFGAEPNVTRSVCKIVGGVLQCNVEGTANYKRFDYELDLRTANENGKMCVSSVALPK